MGTSLEPSLELLRGRPSGGYSNGSDCQKDERSPRCRPKGQLSRQLLATSRKYLVRKHLSGNLGRLATEAAWGAVHGVEVFCHFDRNRMLTAGVSC
jgi:hypothetical protein